MAQYSYYQLIRLNKIFLTSLISTWRPRAIIDVNKSSYSPWEGSRTKNKRFSLQDDLLPTILVKLRVVRRGEKVSAAGNQTLALSRVGTTLGGHGRQKISPKTPCGVKKNGWCPKNFFIDI